MDWFKDNYNSIIITLIGGLIFFILYIIYDLGSKLSLIFSSDKKKTKKEFEKIIGILIDCYYLNELNSKLNLLKQFFIENPKIKKISQNNKFYENWLENLDNPFLDSNWSGWSTKRFNEMHDELLGLKFHKFNYYNSKRNHIINKKLKENN